MKKILGKNMLMNILWKGDEMKAMKERIREVEEGGTVGRRKGEKTVTETKYTGKKSE